MSHPTTAAKVAAPADIFPIRHQPLRSCSEVEEDETARAIRDQQIIMVQLIDKGRELNTRERRTAA